jgi:hypothetical protein
MHNYTAKDFKFIHTVVAEELNSSKILKKFKLEVVPYIGTLAGTLTFCIAKKIDIDNKIEQMRFENIPYRGKFKGVSFERCNNYSGDHILSIEIDRRSAWPGEYYYIYAYPNKNASNHFIYLDDYFYRDNQGNRNYVKKIPDNLGTKLLKFFEFIYNGKNIKNLTVEDNLELFKISNIIEIGKFDDVLLKYMQIYKDWCRLNDKEIYDKKDRPIIHKEFVKEDHY